MGEWGRGWARSQIIRAWESLALYKSFNILWPEQSLSFIHLHAVLFCCSLRWSLQKLFTGKYVEFYIEFWPFLLLGFITVNSAVFLMSDYLVSFNILCLEIKNFSCLNYRLMLPGQSVTVSWPNNTTFFHSKAIVANPRHMTGANGTAGFL
jgi:hypothetical protein